MPKPSDILSRTGLGGHSAGSLKAKGGTPSDNPFAPAKSAESDPTRTAAPKSQRAGGHTAAPEPAASKVTGVRPKV